MPKPTQAEVAALVGRLRAHWHESMDQIEEPCAVCQRAADALEALAGEGAEPVAQPVAWLHRCTAPCSASPYYVVHDTVKQLWDKVDPKHCEHYSIPLYAAPPAKPAGELPPLPEPLFDDPKGHGHDLYDAEQMRAYALRALRERA